MCNSSDKAQFELISLLLWRSHSIELQNGKENAGLEIVLGSSWGGNGPSRSQRLGQLEPTWGVLYRPESVGLVVGPLWVGFWCVWAPFWLHFGSVWVRIGFVRFALVSLSSRVDAASVSFSFPFSHPRRPSDARNSHNKNSISEQGDPKLTTVRSVVRLPSRPPHKTMPS